MRLLNIFSLKRNEMSLVHMFTVNPEICVTECIGDDFEESKRPVVTVSSIEFVMVQFFVDVTVRRKFSS